MAIILLFPANSGIPTTALYRWDSGRTPAPKVGAGAGVYDLRECQCDFSNPPWSTSTGCGARLRLYALLLDLMPWRYLVAHDLAAGLCRLLQVSGKAVFKKPPRF